MHLDAIDLKDFYARRLGLLVRRLLRRRIRARWKDVKGMRVFGLGFATPYLAEFRGEAHALGALMPARFGALSWPPHGPSMATLVDETELPLADETADRILLVHMLEWSERSRTLLREIWRVLGPGGRLLIVVPNRRGLWARVDTTPFGYGSPFSRSQLTQLLKECMFDPEGWQYALYMPPFNWRVLMRWPTFWERLGLFLWPIFSGVIVVEATKQVYAAMPAREAKRKMRRRIVPVPAGVAPRKTAD
jgi:SAM-dependent methyltransferase